MNDSVASRPRAEIVVDLDAVRHNVATLKRRVDGRQMMTVVKADGYGHGMIPVARAARQGGAVWLGAATMEEALALRDSGDTGRVLTWLTVPGAARAERQPVGSGTRPPATAPRRRRSSASAAERSRCAGMIA